MKPHPGADGKLGTNDDRPHVGQGVVVPICGQELIEQDAAQADARADRSAVGSCYTTNPPTSGPMWDQPAGFRIYKNPVPKENAVHAMEHQGVVVWYNTTNEELIEQLEGIVQEELDRRRRVLMTKYSEMEPETIALTAWTRLDKFSVSEFTKRRVQDFIEKHQGRLNPEGI